MGVLDRLRGRTEESERAGSTDSFAEALAAGLRHLDRDVALSEVVETGPDQYRASVRLQSGLELTVLGSSGRLEEGERSSSWTSADFYLGERPLGGFALVDDSGFEFDPGLKNELLEAEHSLRQGQPPLSEIEDATPAVVGTGAAAEIEH